MVGTVRARHGVRRTMLIIARDLNIQKRPDPDFLVVTVNAVLLSLRRAALRRRNLGKYSQYYVVVPPPPPKY